MTSVYTPPVVDEHVEDTEGDYKEGRRPLRFETNSHHDASCKPNQRNKEAGEGPLTLNHESKEEENKEDTARQKETGSVSAWQPGRYAENHALFLAVGFAQCRKTSKECFPRVH